MILLFALVGLIAHLLNALPDIAIDRKAGKGGLAVSLGRKRTLGLAAGLILVFIYGAFYLFVAANW
jgi:4-hydroxybenzoate polyprenyltransferase